MGKITTSEGKMQAQKAMRIPSVQHSTVMCNEREEDSMKYCQLREGQDRRKGGAGLERALNAEFTNQDKQPSDPTFLNR